MTRPLQCFLFVLSLAALLSGCSGSDGRQMAPNTESDSQPSIDLEISELDMMHDAVYPDSQDFDQGLSDASTNSDALVLSDAGLDASEIDAAPTNCVTPLAHLDFVAWPRVFEGNCTGCHLPGGPAEQADAGFVIRPVEPPVRESRQDALQFNLEQITAHSRDVMGESYIVKKALGELDHGGGARIARDSTEHEALSRLIDLIAQRDDNCAEDPAETASYAEISQRMVLKDAEQTWRAFCVQTMGRLPTSAELNRLKTGNRLSDNRNDAQPNDRANAERLAAESNSQFRTLHVMMGEALGRRETHAWLKDVWNDVFLFRGIYNQALGRPYEVFSPWDYGARHWSDMCDIEVLETDADGEPIIGQGRQRMCELHADRFAFTQVLQPNTYGDGYSAQPVLSPVDACDDCRFTRYGVAEWMLYGAIESPLELIAYTIQNERAFTDVLTSGIFMNYYTSLVFFGTADEALNPFVADMDDVPSFNDLRNGEERIVYDVAMPDHRHFKRFDRMRRTRQITREYTYQKTDDDGEPILNDAGVPEEETGQMRTFVYRSDESEAQYDEFPRAGILTTPAFLTRFPSNEFNLHRHRAWQTLRLFLDYDILDNQGERISLADVDDPNGDATTDPNGDCVNCHVRLDPVSGLFRDFTVTGSSLSPSSADTQWPQAIHSPGWPSLDGRPAINHDRNLHGSSIQFLADRIIASPRFPRAMVKHAWTQVIGRPPLTVTADPSADDFEARSTLLLAQQRFFDSLVSTFVSTEFNMKRVYQRLFGSVWYRMQALTAEGEEMIPNSVYADIGRVGPVTPEAYFRRIEAIYGSPWPMNAIRQTTTTRNVPTEEDLKKDFFIRTDSYNKFFDKYLGMLDASFSAFFGGIDFQNSLTRARLMNSLMSLMSRRVANEFACLSIPEDMLKAPGDRRFLKLMPVYRARPDIPNERAVRETIVHLYQLILGQTFEVDSADVNIVFDLWQDVRNRLIEEMDNGGSSSIPDHCEAMGVDNRRIRTIRDLTGQIRAWMAVTTFMMLQPELLEQ